MFIITDKEKARPDGEGRREGVGVMKDEGLNLEEIQASHTLGGPGRCYTVVIHT